MILKPGHTRWDALKYESQRLILVHELAVHGGSVAATARALGLARSYLSRLKTEFGLAPRTKGWAVPNRAPSPRWLVEQAMNASLVCRGRTLQTQKEVVGLMLTYAADAVAQAVRAERERCAQIAETACDLVATGKPSCIWWCHRDVAKALRREPTIEEVSGAVDPDHLPDLGRARD